MSHVLGLQQFVKLLLRQPAFGDDEIINTAAIAKEALKTGGSVYDLVIAKGWLTKERLDELLKPENMTHPRLNR